jgi:hypothetical protein
MSYDIVYVIIYLKLQRIRYLNNANCFDLFYLLFVIRARAKIK